MGWVTMYIWAGVAVEWWARCSPSGPTIPRNRRDLLIRLASWPYGVVVILRRHSGDMSE